MHRLPSCLCVCYQIASTESLSTPTPLSLSLFLLPFCCVHMSCSIITTIHHTPCSTHLLCVSIRSCVVTDFRIAPIQNELRTHSHSHVRLFRGTCLHLLLTAFTSVSRLVLVLFALCCSLFLRSYELLFISFDIHRVMRIRNKLPIFTTDSSHRIACFLAPAADGTSGTKKRNEYSVRRS